MADSIDATTKNNHNDTKHDEKTYTFDEITKFAQLYKPQDSTRTNTTREPSKAMYLTGNDNSAPSLKDVTTCASLQERVAALQEYLDDIRTYVAGNYIEGSGFAKKLLTGLEDLVQTWLREPTRSRARIDASSIKFENHDTKIDTSNHDTYARRVLQRLRSTTRESAQAKRRISMQISGETQLLQYLFEITQAYGPRKATDITELTDYLSNPAIRANNTQQLEAQISRWMGIEMHMQTLG